MSVELVSDGTFARLDELAHAVAALLSTDSAWQTDAGAVRDEWDGLLDSAIAAVWVAAQRER